MKELVNIVFPILSTIPAKQDIPLLEQYQEQLGGFTITFLKGETHTVPETLQKIFINADVISFDDRYFRDRTTFTRLLLDQEIYEHFSWTRFLLIGDPEIMINKNELAYWCRQGYDLIQHFPDFEQKLSLADRALKKISPDRYIQKFSDEIYLFDQKGSFSLRKVDTFARMVRNKKRAIHNFLAKYPNCQSDSILWEYYVNRLTPQLIVPNAISRNRFVQSANFVKHEMEMPFATRV